MKLLSKSMIASILSTLVAASAMAQCPQGGCPWGSYNRNYGGGQAGFKYQQGYTNQNPQYYYDNQGSWDQQSSRNYPYPYGAQSYYSDFEQQPGMMHPEMQQYGSMQRQSTYYTDVQQFDQNQRNLRGDQRFNQNRNYGAPQDSSWSTTSVNQNPNQLNQNIPDQQQNIPNSQLQNQNNPR